jgi:hypothetical protein
MEEAVRQEPVAGEGKARLPIRRRGTGPDAGRAERNHVEGLVQLPVVEMAAGKYPPGMVGQSATRETWRAYLFVGFVVREEAVLDDEPAPIRREEGNRLVQGTIALQHAHTQRESGLKTCRAIPGGGEGKARQAPCPCRATR